MDTQPVLLGSGALKTHVHVVFRMKWHKVHIFSLLFLYSIERDPRQLTEADVGVMSVGKRRYGDLAMRKHWQRCQPLV